MTKKVLVTGAGGQAGVNVIKALISEGYDVVAADANELAAGLFIVEKSRVIPFADDPRFAGELADICRTENIDYLVPTVEQEVFPIADNIGQFEQLGVKVLMSSRETVEKTYNKLLTSQELARANIPAPKFGDPSTESLDQIVDRLRFPVFLKPIYGSGSRGTAKAANRAELEFYLRSPSGFIAQEFIDGIEYTVDCLFNPDSTLVAHVVREDIEVKAGYSYKNVTVLNKEMEDISVRVGKAFRLQYGVCIQYIVGKDGIPKVIEINSRFAGGLSLSTASGINMPDIALRMLEGEKFGYIGYKPGAIMTRCLEDHFIIGGKVYPSPSSITHSYKPRIILAIGAHPDDIEGGCSGALITHKDMRHKIYGLILTDGERKGDGKIRIGEAEKAGEMMGLDGLYFLHLSDGKLTDDIEVVSRIREIIYETKADTVYTHTEKNFHQDHRNAFRAVMSAANGVPRILLFESIRYHPDFSPEVFVDITQAFERKIAVLNYHKSELLNNGISVNGVESMARYWGSKIGVPYAEAFELGFLKLGPAAI